VHAADPTGAHEADPDAPADRERAADRRRADRVLHGGRGEVARAELARLGVEALELRLVEPDAHGTVEHADRRRHRAGLPDATLALQSHRDALARRKAVRDQRRLEGDDRSAVAERVLHLSGDDHHGIVPSFETQRAAASRPSSGPPTR
jgi:hypothetical protein